MKHSSPQPPAWALRLLRWYCNPELLEEIQGDLYEAFIERIEQRGLRYARRHYVGDVLRFIRPFAQESRRTPYRPARRAELLRNYVRLSARYLLKHPGFFVINVLGLAVGIATCLAIMHHVRFELSYDAFHQYSDRLYRVSATLYTPESVDRLAPTAYGVGPSLQEELPEVVAAVRLVPTMAVVKDKEGTLFNEETFFQADPAIFRVFTYPLLAGDPTTALVAPHSVVLSQTLAKKYFGAVNPASLIGTSLLVNQQPHTITGVTKDIPQNSDLRFDALLSWEYDPNEWLEIGSFTYLLLKDAESANVVQEKLRVFDEQQVNPRIRQAWGADNISMSHALLPITELHYTTNLLGDTEDKGNRTYVYIFALVAACILSVACINYVNLSIAQAVRRTTEVGVAKAMGASQLQLWTQYMSECFITTLLAVVFALGLVLLAGQHVADLLGERITWLTLTQSGGLYTVLGILTLVSILAGSYPALMLSAAHPVRALRGGSLLAHRRGRLRKVLIVMQFAVAISIVASTLVVRNQLAYMRHKDLGFRQDQILAIGIPDDSAAKQKTQILKHTLQQDTRVAGVTVGSRPDALWSLSAFSVTAQGKTRHLSVKGINVDRDYLEVLDLPLVVGRNFSPMTSDAMAPNQVIVNEAFVREVGWNEPVGQEMVFSDTDVKVVVGVVQDFHYASLHRRIEPLILFYDTSVPVNLLVQVAPNDTEVIRAAWADIFPDFPLEFGFLDEAFEQKYRIEWRMLTLFDYFSGLSIFIACLGLLSLTAFTVQQKTQEIGIRKVMGAGRVAILYLLSREFGWLLLLSIIIATPLAYVAIRFWLQNFAYRTPIGGTVFLLSAGGVTLLALVTLSYHTLRAAAANPVDTLRHE